MDMQEEVAQLSRHAEHVVPKTAIADKLALARQEGRPLRVKLGFDPTSADLHLGHAVVLRKLRAFAELGHQVVLVVGGFTARIGDPTGRNRSRPPLSAEAIEANARTYLHQFGKVVDVSRVEVLDNSAWLSALSANDIIKLMSHVTVSQILQRTDFNARYVAQKPIGMHELLYPLMQAYDSVHTRADIELGGTDQLFNCMLGRDLQAAMGQRPQAVICMPLLVGTDGVQKMSKSYGNGIGLTEDATNMFGKLMSIPDTLLPAYLELTTTMLPAQVQIYGEQLTAGAINPMEVKLAMAENVTSAYWGAQKAKEAYTLFRSRFGTRQLHDAAYEDVELETLGLGPHAILRDVCRALLPDASRSHIRRLIEGRAVQVDTEAVTDVLAIVPQTTFRIRLGKRGFFRVIVPLSKSS